MEKSTLDGDNKDSIETRVTFNLYTCHKPHCNDDCGIEILGEENKKFWHDYKGANINSRTKSMIKNQIQ